MIKITLNGWVSLCPSTGLWMMFETMQTSYFISSVTTLDNDLDLKIKCSQLTILLVYFLLFLSTTTHKFGGCFPVVYRNNGSKLLCKPSQLLRCRTIELGGFFPAVPFQTFNLCWCFFVEKKYKHKHIYNIYVIYIPYIYHKYAFWQYNLKQRGAAVIQSGANRVHANECDMLRILIETCSHSLFRIWDQESCVLFLYL